MSDDQYSSEETDNQEIASSILVQASGTRDLK